MNGAQLRTARLKTAQSRTVQPWTAHLRMARPRVGGSRLNLSLVICFLLLAATRISSAQEASRDEIPPELRPWIPWVTAELGSELCAELSGRKECQWPGLLELELDDTGGEFSFFVEIDARGLRGVPGGRGAWPQQVEVDGEKAPVLSREERPVVELSPGRHRIDGRFSWKKLPETLEVGSDTAFVNLQVRGESVPLVKREEGKLWLKGFSGSQEASEEPEHVELSVFRQIQDGVPILVETRLVLQVAGRARELTLVTPLLLDALPLSVRADLALALEPSGNLRVQLLPGRHEVTLLSRHTRPGAPLENRPRPSPWPKEEVWTFRPKPELRSVELRGLAGIDASRTDLPSAWRSLGAYIARSDAKLTLETTRRGQEQVPDNQLQIRREFWLDEKAKGFTVRDHITGTMHRDFRLDLCCGKLGSVEIDGVSQVITRHSGQSGVEIRDTALNLTAVSRVERTGKLNAVGWTEDAKSLSAELHLPPGWDVLFAAGVDETSRTWLARWDLFDVFYLLLVSLAMGRLCGWPGGAIAALALLLVRGENGAPEYIWLPLLVLAALMNLRWKGRLRTWVSFLFYALGFITVVVLVGFSVEQVKSALYPHLERTSLGLRQLEQTMVAPAPEPSVEMDAREQAGEALQEDLEEHLDAPQDLPQSPLRRKATQSLKSKREHGSSDDFNLYGTKNAQKQFQPDAIVQTGPGIPEAPGHAFYLSWTGPVVEQHEFSLILLSPTINRVLTVLRLTAVWALAYLLFRLSKNTRPKPTTGRRAPRSKSPVAAAMLLLGILFLPRPAHADEPSEARLTELKSRLTKPPRCAPNCVSVSNMVLDLGKRLTVRATVHAGGRTVYKLPGPASELLKPRVLVDGRPAQALRLETDGALYLRLDEGVFEVTLEASLRRDRLTLDMGTSPEQISANSQGWSINGINEHGRAAGGTLTFQRESAIVKQGETRENQIAVPPFFHVTRTIQLGVTSSVLSTIGRLSDASSPEVLVLPLLTDEQLTSSGIEVENGAAHITFPREETQRQLVSSLRLDKEADMVELVLTAPTVEERSETWILECGVVYHCQAEGVVASSHQAAGRAVSTYRPFPGETLKIVASRPTPAEGSSVTIHEAKTTLTPGTRTGRGRLELSVQTSRSIVHTVSVPSNAKLESVLVNGREQAVKANEGKVQVALLPGTSKVILEWQAPEGLKPWFQSPRVHAGAPGVNFRSIVELPKGRWLLAAGGPSQGPALLFWSYLCLILVAALLLPRLPYCPLDARQWLLLGLGLTQVPAGVAVFVAAWFFAIAGRRHVPFFGRYRQNLLQVFLIIYTLAFLACLAGAVYEGLVSSPDMEVQGAGSSNGQLVWYRDRSEGPFPSVWVLSVNLWIWRAFMLTWALWLSRSLLDWLRWTWQELNAGGFWVKAPPRRVSPGGAQKADRGAQEADGVQTAKAPSQEPLEDPPQEDKPPNKS